MSSPNIDTVSGRMRIMSAKDAKPEHYKVDRTGGLPTNGQFYVLDIVNDFECRVALAKLGTQYERQGQHVRAAEVFEALHASQDAHKAVCEAKNPRLKKSGKADQAVKHA